MHPILPKGYFRFVFIVGLLGFGLWRVFGIAVGQDLPPGSLFLPNISVSLSTSSDLAYDFNSDSESEAVWATVSDGFGQYGTLLTRQGATIEIAVDENGAQHRIATIRCVGQGCGADAATENAASSSGVLAPENLELGVQLDASRRLVFRPLSVNNLDLDLMMDSQLLKHISFTCPECTIEVTVNQLFATPTPTSTSTATAKPPTLTPTSTSTATAKPPTLTPTSTSTATAKPPTSTPTPVSTQTPTATPTSTRPPVVGASGSFSETFDGDPATPLAWSSSAWDITVHSRDRETFAQLESMNAMHGAHCEAPMATHLISAYPDAVFQCKSHLMTAINAGGYGVIYLTPAYQVDFSNGTATIRFDVSTLRTSHRDWIDLYISPMEDHLQLPLEDWLPDLSGEPKRAVKIKMEVFNGETPFKAYLIKNHVSQDVDSNWWTGYEKYLTPSATDRTTFELQISKTHIKFGMPKYNFWWVDKDIAPLDWSVGVVQFGHHSYNPMKECDVAGGCSPNTWHWDNVSINPARPFTMIHATKRYADAASGTVVNFDAPAPANAFLRFAGIGKNIEVSFDGGITWNAAQVQDQVKHVEEAFWSYFTPIPANVQSVQFRAQDWWGGPWLVRDLSIWAK